MKTILAAMIVACMSVPAAVAPASAVSLTITTDNGIYYGDRSDWRYRHHHRRHWRGEWRRHHHWRRHHRDCYVKVRRHWHHHRLIVRKVRICD